MEEGGYTEETMFNADETGLLIKPMLTKSYVAANQKLMAGHKINKERITILFGGNAAGNLKLTPLVIGRSKNPRAFKNIDKRGLPVIYMNNTKAWMTHYIFKEWFYRHFCIETKRFCEEKGIPFKVLLLLDNAGGHPPASELDHPNVKVRFLPANTTSLIQPMDMGVISTFKKYYLRNTYEKALLATDPDGPKRVDLPEYWKKFNILDSIYETSKAWNALSQHTMQSMWNNVLERKSGNDTEGTEITSEIVNLGQKLDMNDLDENFVNEAIEPMGVALSNDELLEMEKENATQNSDDEDEEEIEPKLNITNVSKGVDLIKQGLELIRENDPATDRRIPIILGIENIIKPYETIIAQAEVKKRQSKIDSYFTRKE